ncbi:unnamed protein product [Pipistrellus nathusii]|uniref:Proto-oncogene FRAT1 n=1 Tax=Pipistrellus nathusii TaxID=59473 RepID=A0ABN9ZD32_PIPNA
MPCRREEEEEAGEEAEAEEEEEERGGFLLLERPVTRGGSGEVDRLVAQIGETLQLDAGPDRPASPCAPPAPPPALQPPRPPADKARPPDRPLPPPPPPGALRCALGERGRVRGRAAPYFVAELAAGPSALSPHPGLDGPSRADKRGAPKQPLSGPCRRGWLRGAAAPRRLQQRRGPQPETRPGGDDDPHRLLQQLVLSGTLIKEAVRRLHSRRLQLQPKLPPLPRPPAAAAHDPPSPRSPRAAGGDPGAAGRRAPPRPGDGVPVPGS